MSLTYRPLERTDADYALLAEIINSDTDMPTTVEDQRDSDKHQDADLVRFDEFALHEGKVVGHLSCHQIRERETAKAFVIGVHVHKARQNQGFEFEMLSRTMAHAVDSGATRVMAAERDYRTARIEAFERLGMVVSQRDPSSKLDLECFDPHRYDEVIARVEAGGVRYRTVAEFAREGVDWIPLAYTLQEELYKDVPGHDRLEQMPLEEYRKWFESPAYRVLEDWVIAVDGEKWVGMSNLYAPKHNPELALTALTGVVRSHRRRGIATALKAKVLSGAKEAGVKFVKTGNEENNPMFKLNLALGFVPDYTVLVFEKEIVRKC